MLTTIAIFAALLLALYVLYQFGLITLDVKRSTVYIASQLSSRARYRSCTGTVRRILRFREAKSVSFTLNASLEKGTVTVDISGGDQHLLLDAENPSATLSVQPGVRYTQIIRFNDATGEHTITKA